MTFRFLLRLSVLLILLAGHTQTAPWLACPERVIVAYPHCGTTDVAGRLLVDLIVVGANPLEDIDHVRQSRLVMKEGRIVSDKRG